MTYIEKGLSLKKLSFLRLKRVVLTAKQAKETIIRTYCGYKCYVICLKWETKAVSMYISDWFRSRWGLHINQCHHRLNWGSKHRIFSKSNKLTLQGPGAKGRASTVWWNNADTTKLAISLSIAWLAIDNHDIRCGCIAYFPLSWLWVTLNRL